MSKEKKTIYAALEKMPEEAALRDCIVVAPDGFGRARLAVRTASLLGSRRVLIVTPKPYFRGVWGEDLEAALGGSGRSIHAGTGRDEGGAIMRQASTDIRPEAGFYVIAPNQAAAAGAWCQANSHSPFGLVVVDRPGMYLNRQSERARGIESLTGFPGQRCIGLAGPADLENLARMDATCWGSAYVACAAPAAACGCEAYGMDAD